MAYHVRTGEEEKYYEVTTVTTIHDVTRSSTNTTQGAATRSTDKKHLGGVYMSIFLAAAAPCFVIFIVIGVLIGLTFAYRVDISSGHPGLSFSTSISGPGGISVWIDEAKDFEANGGGDAYLIQFNPSSLTTIASWTAKLIPYLSSAMMALAAFFAADHIRRMKSSYGQSSDKKLAPQQMSILVGLLSGGMDQLWNALYCRFRTGMRFHDPTPIVFTTLVVTTALGFAISLVDTWFGVVVHPGQETQLSIVTPPSLAFGRGLITDNSCTDSALQLLNGEYLPCNLAPGAEGTVLLSNAEAFRVLNNMSTTNVVMQIPGAAPAETLYYLGDVDSSTYVDFKATSLAISTQCQGISDRCGLNSTSGSGGQFHCTDAFSGNLNWSGQIGSSDNGSSPSRVGIKFFGDSGLTQSISVPGGYSQQNPMYFGIWATSQTGTDTPDPSAMSSNGVAAWVLNCSATVYDATYAWVNGSVASFNTTISNSTVGGIVSAAFAGGFAAVPLQNAATLAGISVSIGDTTAAYFSQSALALAIGAIISDANLLEQNRTVENFARVPLIPFYMLVGLNAAYALMAIFLALAVILLANPAESKHVKAKLNIRDLIASNFDSEKFKDEAIDDVNDELAGTRNRNGRGAAGKGSGAGGGEQNGWEDIETAERVAHDGRAIGEFFEAVTGK